MDTLDLVVPAVADLRAWRPELALVATFLVATPLSLKSRGRWTWLPRGVTALGLFAATAIAARGLRDTGMLGDDFRLDAAASLARLVVDAAALLVVLLGALGWRRAPRAGELPVRVYPYFALHALALGLLSQAVTITGAVVAIMGATLGATLLAGLSTRTAGVRAVVLRASLAAAAGAAFAVYGLSLRYPLAGTGALTVAVPFLPALGASALVTVFGLLVAFGASPALWVRGDGGKGPPAAITGFLAGLPVFAAAPLVWRLVPGGLPGPWLTALAGVGAVLLAAGALGAFGARPAAARFTWASLSQAGYLLLAPAVAEFTLAPVLRHLALVALGGVVVWGFAHLAGTTRPTLTRLISRLFLVGLAGLPLVLVLALRSAGRPALVAVAALGLLGSLGYLRLAFTTEPVREPE